MNQRNHKRLCALCTEEEYKVICIHAVVKSKLRH